MPASPNFDIIIASEPPPWTVHAHYPDNQHAASPITLPFDVGTMPEQPGYIDDWVHMACRAAGIDDTLAPPASELGRKLFESLFTGQIEALYEKFVKNLPHKNQQHLLWRLRLRLPNHLDVIPWELLCQGNSKHLAFDANFPMVRSPQPAEHCAPLHSTPIGGPLRVVAVLANPRQSSGGTLDIDRHRALLATALTQTGPDILFKLECIEGHNTLEQLTRRLQQPEPIHILHIFCYGEIDPHDSQMLLHFVDKHGNVDIVSPAMLPYHLTDRYPHGELRGDIRVVTVWTCCATAASAGRHCFSQLGTALVRAGIPAAVTMQFKLTEEAANRWTQLLYQEIAHPAPVDVALTRARRRLWNTRDWAIPMLFVHPDADCAVLLQPSIPSTSNPIKSHYRTTLRHALNKYFNEGELRDLCADLGFDYDDLPGDGKSNKARELIAYCERREWISELVQYIKDHRPNAFLPPP